MLPYRIAQDEAGLRRGYLSGVQPGIESFLASPSRLHLYPPGEVPADFTKEADAYLFPGILVLILAAIAIASCSPASRQGSGTASAPNIHRVLSAARLLSVMMFIDRPFELWRYVYWLPGFNFIRVPSRFIILTMLALSVLAGMGFDRIARADRSGCVRSRSWSAATAARRVLELSLRGVPYQVDIPAIDRWLDTQPKPFVVAELPVPSPAIWESWNASKRDRCCTRWRTGRRPSMAIAAFAAHSTNSSISTPRLFPIPQASTAFAALA
jgi:hypothetical protein